MHDALQSGIQSKAKAVGGSLESEWLERMREPGDHEMLEPEINILLTQAQRKVVADLLPKFGYRLKLDERHARTISFPAKDLRAIRQKAEATRPHATHGMKRNSLRHVVDAITQALEKPAGVGSIPTSARLYQFKITLLKSMPEIWRRIQVKDSSLDKFHERIQTAMGWTNRPLCSDTNDQLA